MKGIMIITLTLVIFMVTWSTVNGFGEDCSNDSTVCKEENEECKDWLESKTCQCKEGFPVIVNGKCAKGVAVKRLTPSKPGDDCTSTKKCSGVHQECKENEGASNDGENSDKKEKTCQCHSDYPVIVDGKCTEEEKESKESESSTVTVDKENKNDEL